MKLFSTEPPNPTELGGALSLPLKEETQAQSRETTGPSPMAGRAGSGFSGPWAPVPVDTWGTEEEGFLEGELKTLSSMC